MNAYICCVKSCVNVPMAIPMEMIRPAILDISLGVVVGRAVTASNDRINCSNFGVGTENSICVVSRIKPSNIPFCVGTKLDLLALIVRPAFKRSVYTVSAMRFIFEYPRSPKIPSSK